LKLFHKEAIVSGFTAPLFSFEFPCNFSYPREGFAKAMHAQIPKRIIQTGKSRLLPLRQRTAVSTVKLLNADFEHLFFDDDDVNAFIENESPEYRRVFASYRFPIQRIDFFRYLAIYRYGGFYFDTDVYLARGVSSLLQYGCVFPFERPNMSRFLRRRFAMDWDIGNYAFGAAPGHEFMGAIIENCVRAQEDQNWIGPMMQGIPRLLRDDFCVLNSTGPGLVSRTLAENAGLAQTVTVLFPNDVRDPENWHCFGDFGFHQMQGSWRRRDGVLRRRVASYLEHRTFRGFLEETRRLGGARTHASSLPGTPIASSHDRAPRLATDHVSFPATRMPAD
jgi:hypothetical protein